MTSTLKKVTQEEILLPLRELYRRDSEQRELIAKYAKRFKVYGFFLGHEVNFLRERLSVHNIDFDSDLLRVKLLSIELVPSSCWFSNVRDHVPKKTWDFLRKSTYKKAKYQCEICGGRGDKWPVECHEIWHYDDLLHTQTLSELTALCPKCHQVKHIGLAGIKGQAEIAEAHLAKINGWGIEQMKIYLETVWDTWEQRSCYSWTLNLSHLEAHGVHIDSKR